MKQPFLIKYSGGTTGGYLLVYEENEQLAIQRVKNEYFFLSNLSVTSATLHSTEELTSTPYTEESSILNKEIVDLDLGWRSFMVLKSCNVKTLADLTKMSKLDLQRKRNCGKKMLEEIEAVLLEHGLTLSV